MRKNTLKHTSHIGHSKLLYGRHRLVLETEGHFVQLQIGCPTGVKATKLRLTGRIIDTVRVYLFYLTLCTLACQTPEPD